MPALAPLDNDSVYYYIKQDQKRSNDVTFIRLMECELDNVPVMIYMEMKGWEMSIYACMYPCSVRYPSTILLGRYDEEKGMRDWFEAKDGVIHTYKLCDFGEIVYTVCQDYVIRDGKFVQDSSYTNYFVDDGSPRESDSYYLALWHRFSIYL